MITLSVVSLPLDLGRREFIDPLDPPDASGAQSSCARRFAPCRESMKRGCMASTPPPRATPAHDGAAREAAPPMIRHLTAAQKSHRRVAAAPAAAPCHGRTRGHAEASSRAPRPDLVSVWRRLRGRPSRCPCRSGGRSRPGQPAGDEPEVVVDRHRHLGVVAAAERATRRAVRRRR